jgi:hypothetical protein
MNIIFSNSRFLESRSSASRASQVRPDALVSSASHPIYGWAPIPCTRSGFSRADALIDRVPEGSILWGASGRTQTGDCVPDALAGQNGGGAS